MENYEIIFILAPGLGEAGTKSELDTVRELITSNKGKIVHEDIWGIRDLAYRIGKHDQGYYAVFNFKMETRSVKELDKPLNINQSVLRFLVIKTPSSYEFKTLEDFEAEKLPDVESEEIKKAAKAKSEARAERGKPVERPKVEKPVEVPAEKPKKEEKEIKKPKLEDLDEKLKNIINDPDISL